LLLLNKLLEDGNALYKREKLSDAIYRYEYALKRLPDLNQDGVGGSSSSSSSGAAAGEKEGGGGRRRRHRDLRLVEVYAKLESHLLLNLSQVSRRRKL